MGSCFSCNKKLNYFYSYSRSKRDILLSGYHPPENMTKSDNLCKTCVKELKKSQTRGRRYSEAKSMLGQMILCVFAPGIAALRIERWMKMWAYSVFPQYAIIILIGFFEIQFYEFPIIALLLYFTFPLNFYWIHRWTKEWNEKYHAI